MDGGRPLWSRSIEPEERGPYKDLLASRRVRRIYLDEATVTGKAPPGLMILQLISCSDPEAYELVEGLRLRVRKEPDCERAAHIIELMEEVLIRRYPDKDREELRRMFKLHDIRETRVWKEAHKKGRRQGRRHRKGKASKRQGRRRRKARRTVERNERKSW